MPTGECPICGQTEKWNTEDVLPQWVRRHAVVAAPGERFTGTLASGKAFDAPVPFQITVQVGEPCNSWMGRTFEAPTAPRMVPLLDGAVLTLQPEDQELIARWVAKTTLMNALAHPPSPPLSVYQEFRASGDPPPGFRALLGFYSSPGALAETQQAFRLPRPGTLPAGTRIEFVPLNVILGQLVIVGYIPLQGPLVRTEAEANGALVEIWPPTGMPVEWPPAVGLDATEVGAAWTWELA